MDMIKTIENTEKYQEQLTELFKETASDALLEAWEDTFRLEEVEEKQVIISYQGSAPIKKFKKACKGTLSACVKSLWGVEKKIRICKKSRYDALSPNARKNLKALKFFVIGAMFICFATAVVIILCNYIGNRTFRETFYSASSIKVDSRLRVIQLSDLHGDAYGKDNQRLLERIKALEPDLILCTGDMVDSAVEDRDFAVALGKELVQIAPAYYIYGNNEVETVYDFPLNEKALDEKFGFDQSNRDETALLKLPDEFEKALESVGVKVLKNEKDTIQVRTMTVDVYGILNSNPSSFWSYSEKAFLSYLNENPEHVKITAVHEPFIFEEFQPDFWGDLLVCGHTHGGVVRVPVLGPLFTKEDGLFPERSGNFIHGRYDAAGSPLIVSGGLENTNPLRINNQPELVVIDVNKF